jgi:hypothetical protein
VILPTETNAPEPDAAAKSRGSGWGRVSMLRGVLVAAVAAALSAGAITPALAADTCANATVRAQTGSSALPDCRGYEMVSPPYKEGFAVDPAGFMGYTDDGIVSYTSFGNFAGNPQGAVPGNYHAERSSVGWMTSALAPPDLLYNTGDAVLSESVDLRRSLWRMSRRDVPDDKTGFFLRGHDGVVTRVSDAGDEAFGGRIVVGASADLSHIVFNHGPQGGPATDLYEYVGVDNGPVARPVSVDNLGQPTLRESCPEGISGDGRVIVYTAACRGVNSEVWARVAASASVAVSGSECTRPSDDPDGPCAGAPAAVYAGGATDGSRVFFTTARQLVNGDTDLTNDLYACDIPAGVPAPVGTANPCASLTQVSGTANNARVERVGPVSEDGARVYFVAQGVLADNLGVGEVGPATGPGAHNLYVWERDGAHLAGETRFVARLDNDELGRGETTPDGRYLLFLTTTSLVGEGPAADTDGIADAYRFDAVTRTMVRVSTSVSGSGGNDPAGFAVSLAHESSMSADGSTVIFDTDEALSGSDVDGVTDVYAWHDGHVSLISVGGGSAMGITASGRDIFFLSDKQVLAADGDFNSDIYDARLGGGFAPAQTVPSCSGDACQGRRSLPPSLAAPLAPATELGELARTPAALSLRAVSTAQRKRLAATGKVSLTVTANAPGTVSVKATATIGGRAVTVGSARRTMVAPGRAVVTLSLSKKARSQLKARGRLTVRVAVGHSKVALDRSVTLRLVRVKAKAKRSVSRGSVVGVVGGRS